MNANHNLLFINNTEKTDELYGILFDWLKEGYFILVLTHSYPDVSTAVQGMNIGKDVLQRLIFMLFSTLDEITAKLLTLHDWILLPHFVVIDMQPFVINATVSTTILQSLYLCLATIFSYMHSIEQRIQNNMQNTLKSICSLVLLPLCASVFDRKQLQLLIDLYYCKGNAFDDFLELRCHMANNIKDNIDCKRY